MGFGSASVLDGLNPLSEGAGRLQLAEKGMNKGGLDTITAHDNFQIIFVINPWYGEPWCGSCFPPWPQADRFQHPISP